LEVEGDIRMGKVEVIIRIDEAIVRRFREIGLDLSEVAEISLRRWIETMQGKPISE